MSGAARIVLLWAVCLTAASADCIVAAPRSTEPQPKLTALTPEGRDLTEIRRLIDSGRYNEAESAARALIEDSNAQAEPPLAKALALDLWVEARWRNGKAWHVGTLEAAEWAASLKEQALGAESADVADSLLHQARVLDEWARFDEARERYDKTIALYRRTVRADDPRLAVALNYLGGMLVELGHLSAARPYLTQSVDTLEAVLGPEHPDLAAALVHAAWLEKHARNLEEARSLFERALRIYETALGGEHPMVAEPLDGLTRLVYEMDEFETARQFGRRAESIRIQALGPKHPSLVFLYVQLWWVEDGQESTRYIDKARAIAESSYPEDHPMVALAISYHALSGSSDEAEVWDDFERAVMIFEKSYGPDHWRVATTLSNMSHMWSVFGERQRAIELLERAASMQEKSEVRRFYSMSLLLLSRHMDLAGREEEAQQIGHEALVAAEMERPPGIVIGGVYELQAGMLKRSGRLQEAEALYRKAIATIESYGGPNHIFLEATLTDFADLQARAGNFQEALAMTRRALAIVTDNFGPESDNNSQGSLDLEAKLLWATGDLAGAFDTALRLETIQRQVFQDAVAGLPERQNLGWLDEQVWGLDTMLSVVIADSRSVDPGSAVDAVIRSRAIVLDSLAQRNRIAKASRDSEIAQLDRELALARERLTRLVVSDETQGNSKQHREKLEEARRDKERAERALAARSRQFQRDHKQETAGLTEVESALPSRTALLAYVRYERFLPPPDGSSASWPLETSPAIAAIVIRTDRDQPELVDLGDASAVETRALALRQRVWDLALAGDRGPKRSLAAYRREGEALRTLIWDRVEPHLRDMDRIFIVPDGDLNLIHLGALPTGTNKYLIEGPFRLHYLTAERDLVGLSEEDSEAQGLLALGDPAFDEPGLFASLASEDSEVFQLARHDLESEGLVFRGRRASCANFAEMRFEELPASAAELQSIASSWGDAVTTSEAKVLRRAAANEAAFKSQSSGKKVIHLATHGFYFGGSCEPTSEAGQLRRLVENPLTLSGLALAGANHREAAGPEEEDGILTAEEIASLDLQGVQWAVLSGCETGVGESMAGEGVFGLRRAFQIAGARTVIMSLWPVDDEATRDWMSALYRHRFEDKMSTDGAIRQASLDLLAARRAAGLSTHPFYWAGFVAAGDWR